MRYILSIALVIVLALSVKASVLNEDATSERGSSNSLNLIDDQWDLLFSSEVGATVNDNQLLGGEFAGDFFYVTSGNNGNDPNIVYILNDQGVMISQFDQWSSPGWGWRDLAYDGTYLYGADDDIIDAFDLDGNPVPEMNIQAPINPARALAYDPVLDHFWTTSFSVGLYEFDRQGNVISSGSHGLSGVYGLAWDDQDPGGPWLWFFDQSGSPQTSIHQFDPINHTMTGFSYQLPLLPGSTDQLAGGLFFSEEWSGYYGLGGVTQGTPDDQVFILELYSTWPAYPNLTYISGSPIPATGGHLVFDIFLINEDSLPMDFDAWLDIEYEGGPPTTIALRTFINFLPGWTINRPNMFFPVPASYAAGSYEMVGRMGSHPTLIFADDGFYWSKLGVSDGSLFQPFVLDGVPNPFVTIEKGFEPVVTDFVLISAYPNPFNPTTTINFTLANAGVVKLTVHDIAGLKVATLVDGFRTVGRHEAFFDASDLTSGVYLYQLTSGGGSLTGKMILLK
jgi:hypothetical protein